MCHGRLPVRGSLAVDHLTCYHVESLLVLDLRPRRLSGPQITKDGAPIEERRFDDGSALLRRTAVGHCIAAGRCRRLCARWWHIDMVPLERTWDLFHSDFLAERRRICLDKQVYTGGLGEQVLLRSRSKAARHD